MPHLPKGEEKILDRCAPLNERIRTVLNTTHGRLVVVAAAAAKLPRIRFHDLRHTHATLALAAGVRPKVVSERLGHASIVIDTHSHTTAVIERRIRDAEAPTARQLLLRWRLA